MVVRPVFVQGREKETGIKDRFLCLNKLNCNIRGLLIIRDGKKLSSVLISVRQVTRLASLTLIYHKVNTSMRLYFKVMAVNYKPTYSCQYHNTIIRHQYANARIYFNSVLISSETNFKIRWIDLFVKSIHIKVI